MTSSTSCRTCSRVSWETCGALSVLAIELGAIATGSPAASARAIASAPSVSTPQTRNVGQRRLERDCHAGDQRAAADAHQHVSEMRRVVGKLKAERSPGRRRRPDRRTDARATIPASIELLERHERAAHVRRQP